MPWSWNAPAIRSLPTAAGFGIRHHGFATVCGPPPAARAVGDSMADWLGYGLELAYADSPEIGILRRHRTNSGLIRTEVRGEYPDWPQTVRELIAGQKPKFVVMMVGINDRRQFREIGQITQALRAVRPTPQRIGARR